MGTGGSDRVWHDDSERETGAAPPDELDDAVRELGDTATVLHVDDDRDLVELTAAYLERKESGLEVLTATTVSDAMNVLDEEPVECVVSDYKMQPTDGMEFFERVREHDGELPFILLTGKGSEELASEAISKGVTDYFQKGHGVDHYAKLGNRIVNAVEQYHSKRRLEENQALFFEQSPLGVIEWNENFEVQRVNPAAESILGYTEEELVGHTWERVVPESEYDTVQEVTDGLLEAEDGYMSVNENVRKDGERIVCEWHNRVVTDGDGVVVAVLSQFQNVTEREEREEAIANLHGVATDLAACGNRAEVYGTTVAAAKEMPAFDQAGVVSQNGGTVEVERASDERLARDLSQQIDPTEFGYDEGTVVVEEVGSGEGPGFGSLIHVPLDGSRAFQVYSGEPEAFDDRDVETAELLAQYASNELERLAYQRELEAKNEKLDEFVSVVSHDLRNPIQVITATLELAEETDDEEYFERCRRAAERMEELLDDLLTLAQERERPFEAESVDLAEHVERCWKNVETGDATVKIDGDCQLEADASRLDQLLENLFNNAVEHGSTSPRSGTPDDVVEHAEGSVTVRVGPVEERRGFYVEDDGPGIPAKKRESIFEHGYSGSQGGTGFGMAIVSQVVDDHGWEINVTESDAGGARFEIGTE